MRFTWLANSPWTSSGYGQQTRITTTRLAALGHQIGVICYHGLEGGVMNLGPNLMCLPKRYHPYGNDIIVPHTQAFGAQFMLSLMDVWVMNPEEYPPSMRWIAYMPVDHEPMPQIVRTKAAQAWKRIAMSKFGVEQLNNAGLDCAYIPHSIETEILRPVDRNEARERLGLPLDRWIIGTVAMNKGNPSRKNFFEHLAAFAQFKRHYPDAFYFLQTDRGEGGNDLVNLPELCRNLGLEEGRDYTFCNQYQNAIGFPPAYFADLYGALNVHLLASAGEGFGIPTLEAQACGTPVITGDWTASSELCLAGQKISKADAEPYYTPLASYQFKPHISAICDALEREYHQPTDTSAAVEQIRREYDADVVTRERWLPFLAEVEAQL